MLTGKRILIGIGGGIAVYRVAELVRLLIRQGATVRCVMTRAAQQFVSPMTFEALSGEQVYTQLFDLTQEREMGHIRLARWADVMLVAPATADLLTKSAHGIAEDLLGTILQARRGAILMAPAMNAAMWESDATQRNIGILCERGVRFVGPDAGELACGEEGMGRLSDPETLVEAIYHAACPKPLAGQRWLVNAGPTFEDWDDIRYLGNRASGRLGFCIARAAAARGATVDLVAGPNTPATPYAVTRHDVRSAADMLAACTSLSDGGDVFVATAAVGDFRFGERHSGKLKRGDTDRMTVELVANPDVVAQIARLPNRPDRVVAFAAERERHVEHARQKLRDKGVDAIFANDADRMGETDGGGWWICGEETLDIESMPKWQLAERLVELAMNMTYQTEQT